MLISGKCPYVTCDISDWNTWQGELPEDGCAQQMRTKNVTKEHHEKSQAESCEGLPTECPTAPSETRQWCKKTIDLPAVYILCTKRSSTLHSFICIPSDLKLD